MVKSINYRSIVWLNREQKKAKIDLWEAKERKALQQDIANLENKLDVLDYLVGLAIKEDDNENA